MSDRLLEDELLEAVRNARPDLSGEALSPGGAEAQAVLERALSVRRGGRSRSAVRRGAPIVVAIGATVLVVAIAILTLRGHTSSGRGGAGGHGEIVDRDGHALSPGLAVQAELEVYYHAELKAGDVLSTSLDASLEQAGQNALRHAIAANPPASGGAYAAIDPENGQVYALGSIHGSATQSAGSVGSAFAPITGLAALESGAWSVGERFDDTGEYCFAGQCRHNTGGAVDGVLDVQSALKVASNDFFYNLGVLTNSPAAPGGTLQEWARAFGVGRPTGVDLPGENPGTLPTPAWRARRNQLEAECDAGTGQFTGKPKHPPGGCGIADGTDRPWSAGDNENLAVGQGDVQVTPLQLAVAYAAIANAGTVVRPHLGRAIDGAGGSVLRTISPPPVMHMDVNPRDLRVIEAGLRAATSEPGGNSADVFASFPEQVYGETGTAQYDGQQDYAWYAGFVPAWATSKPIVVVVTVQRGGFGDVAAAPVARQILSQWFLGRPGPWIVGTSRTL